jgi:hypothetical protein
MCGIIAAVLIVAGLVMWVVIRNREHYEQLID